MSTRRLLSFIGICLAAAALIFGMFGRAFAQNEVKVNGYVIDVTGQAGPQASGPAGQQAVRGAGYLEMTGYHGSLGRVLSGQ